MSALKKYSVLLLGILLSVCVSSCCRQHFLKNFDQVQMKSGQMILEAQGDTVPFTLRVRVPEGLLCGGLKLELTPYLKQDSLKTPFSMFGNPGKNEAIPAYTITGTKGGTYTFRGYFMNFPQLQNSHFVIEWRAEKNGKTAQLSERLIGYGISQIFRLSKPVIELKPGFDADSIRDALLSRSSQNADSYYLLAIMSARLYDSQALQTFLEKALTLNASLKTRIEKEVEFIGYRKEKWFQSLLK